MKTHIRMALGALLLLALSGCTGAGIDAGHDGGVAFIAMAGMLILTVFLLWFFLGRND
jgi:hypothetical protein